MTHNISTAHYPARSVLTILDGFLGVTAVLGGLALLFGWLGIPTDLLVGSPFGSYTVPALALSVLVGGGGALATALMLRQSSRGLAASGVAGLLLVAFEAVELVVIGFSWLLAVYIALGLAILALAAGLWLAGRGDGGRIGLTGDPAARASGPGAGVVGR